MRRREFIALAVSAALPIVAEAQQAGMPVVGLLSSGSAEPNRARLDAFRKGLATTGIIEGKNVAIEYRWAAGGYDHLPAFAAELVRIPVNVLVAFDNTATALAAKSATSTIPIVFSIGTDPVKFGLVSSLNRPGGNVTGVVSLTVGLGVKRLQVLQEMLPNAATIAMLVNPKNPAAESETADVLTAARTSGQNITTIGQSTGIIRAVSLPVKASFNFAKAIESPKLSPFVGCQEPFATVFCALVRYKSHRFFSCSKPFGLNRLRKADYETCQLRDRIWQCRSDG